MPNSMYSLLKSVPTPPLRSAPRLLLRSVHVSCRAGGLLIAAGEKMKGGGGPPRASAIVFVRQAAGENAPAAAAVSGSLVE